MVTGNERATNPRAWLERLPPARRSAIANWYHYAMHNGASAPAAVAYQVFQTVQCRLQWGSAHTAETHLHAVLESLQTDRTGALIHAQSVLHWEALPYEECQRPKAERTVHDQQTCIAQWRVTEQQLHFIRFLGAPEEPPANWVAMPMLIDRLLRVRRGERS